MDWPEGNFAGAKINLAQAEGFLAQDEKYLTQDEEYLAGASSVQSAGGFPTN